MYSCGTSLGYMGTTATHCQLLCFLAPFTAKSLTHLQQLESGLDKSCAFNVYFEESL